MRMITVAVAASMLWPSSGRAESLAESFAHQCAQGGAQQSETCAVLAEALQRRGEGAKHPVEVEAASSAADASTLAIWRKRFGVYVDMVGGEWFSVVEQPIHQTTPYIPPGRTKFRWSVPGERLIVESENPAEKTAANPDGLERVTSETYWDDARQVLVSRTGAVEVVQIAKPDGSVETAETRLGDTTVRSVTSPGANGEITTSSQVLKNGVWSTNYVFRNVRYSPERMVLEQERIRALVQAERALAAEAHAREEQARERRANRWSQVMGAVSGALDVGLGVARAQEDQSRRELDSTLADIDARIAAQQRAEQPQSRPASTPGKHVEPGLKPQQPTTGPHAVLERIAPHSTLEPQGRSQPASGHINAAAKPLRFVLTISLRNKPGDTHNPTCYSNVITRPGPPGWGEPGFLPSGSAEQAIAHIDALKAEFIAACRRSGRDITSEGNLSHVRNQHQGDDERVQSTRPRFADDVSVVLN